jgi:hypothetical protein
MRAELARWRGTKIAAAWLLVFAATFVAVQLVMVMKGREKIGDLASTSAGALLAGWLWVLAGQKIRAIISQNRT